MSPGPDRSAAGPTAATDATADPAGPARLRTFVLADAALTGASVVFMLVVWATVFPSGWLLVVALMVSASGCVMLSALAPLREERVEPAVVRLAVANWAIAVASTAVATFAWPIAVFASLLPAVVSVPYVSRRAFHRYLGVSLAVATGVVALGLLQDVTGLTGEAPVWVLEAVTITFVPGMALLLIELSLANRAHLQRLLESSLAANADLRRSEEELAEAVDELRASRARVVAATDEERRRIARDLHDGSQQRLAALGLNLSVVRELVRRSPEEAARALEELRGSITEAQADLRALVHGIYPPALTEHGIVAALGSAAAVDASRVRLVANGVGRHPPDVEAAVYFCCSEALQNAAKHAGAGASVVVTIAEPEPGWLRFEVEDDGCGFDAGTARGGGGFVSMRDRVGALGGDLEVVERAGEGDAGAGARADARLRRGVGTGGLQDCGCATAALTARSCGMVGKPVALSALRRCVAITIEDEAEIIDCLLTETSQSGKTIKEKYDELQPDHQLDPFDHSGPRRPHCHAYDSRRAGRLRTDRHHRTGVGCGRQDRPPATQVGRPDHLVHDSQLRVVPGVRRGWHRQRHRHGLRRRRRRRR